MKQAKGVGQRKNTVCQIKKSPSATPSIQVDKKEKKHEKGETKMERTTTDEKITRKRGEGLEKKHKQPRRSQQTDKETSSRH